MLKSFLLTLLLILSIQGKALAQSDRWMPLGLPAHVEEEARKAGITYEKVNSFIRKNFRKLIDNVGNVTLESEEFGLDHLIVAKLVFGIERRVEKNPWPTGDDDQFLLKDELTVGYRFGAGLVVYGDIGYIKRYTLVQPVASHRDGMLKGDFIVNLMLPYNIRDQKLPEKYVVMTEGSLEGRGRLKLSGGTIINPFINLTHQTHHSKITLSRTFIDNRRPDTMRVFVDQSNITEWGHQLYASYGLLSYTLFKMALQNGDTTRSFYEVQKNLPEFNEILYRLSVHNETEILKEFSIERRVDDSFRQTTSDISIFGLYSSRSRNRFDEIDEYMTDSEGEMVLVNQQYQHENERERSWFTFVSGEEYFSNILFLAYNEEHKLGRPHVIITTRQNDKRTSLKELKDKYIDAINSIGLNSQTIMLSDETAKIVKKDEPRSTIDTAITLDDSAIEFLQNITEDTFWDHLIAATGIEQRRWKSALLNSNALGRGIRRPDELRPLALKLKTMGRRFDKLNRCEDNHCRIKTLTKILRECVYVSRGRFAPEQLAVIHSLVKGHMKIESNIALVKDDRIIDAMTWNNGVEIDVPQKYYRFNFNKALEIYHLFSN